MAGGSSSKSESKPVDLTPQAFRNLQSPFANVVASMLGYTPANAGGATTTSTPQGPAPTPTQPASGGMPTNDGQMGPNSGYMANNGANASTPPATTAVTGQTYGHSGAGYNNNQIINYGGGPVPGDPNSVLSGIPSYGGQTTAGITGNEQDILNTLMGTIGQSGANSTGSAALDAILSGGTNIPQAGAGAISGIPQVAGSNINPADVQSGFNATNNPLLQAYITASQRATMDNLAQTLVNNGSRFTANGQFIQPTGSSAFDRAQALATQSAANAAGDIASNIGFNAYNLNQTLNQQTGAQNAGNVLQALLGNQGTGLAASTSNAGNALQGALANASNELVASQSNQNAALQGEQNQISAATAQGNLSSTEVQSLVQNLQAQALPRLIEQYGLDQGLQMFNNQVNDLMTLLQTGAGVTSPVVANESKSSSNTKPNLL
jgi:hypothetical protein